MDVVLKDLCMTFICDIVWCLVYSYDHFIHAWYNQNPAISIKLVRSKVIFLVVWVKIIQNLTLTIDLCMILISAIVWYLVYSYEHYIHAKYKQYRAISIELVRSEVIFLVILAKKFRIWPWPLTFAWPWSVQYCDIWYISMSTSSMPNALNILQIVVNCWRQKWFSWWFWTKNSEFDLDLWPLHDLDLCNIVIFVVFL